MTTESMRVGVVGCGNISGIYFKNLCGTRWPETRITACSDLIRERAKAKAAEYEGVRVLTTKKLLADPDVDIVLNLTTPPLHYKVARAAIRAGKHVYSEKPITLKRKEAATLLAEAKAAGVLVGCAPDTFMGAGIQTCIDAVNGGKVGRPVGAAGFMLCPGHESWHPDPEFYYKKGGGPMLDMGPYYVTALIAILGPIKAVLGSTKMTFAERTITSQAKNGTKIQVEVPTHVTGILEFEQGAVGTLVTSFDTQPAALPNIEIIGTEGCLKVPDPNCFNGDVLLRRKGQREYEKLPYVHDISENGRGLGVVDMVRALRENRGHRVSGALASHALDVMLAIHESAARGKRIELSSGCQPAPFRG